MAEEQSNKDQGSENRTGKYVRWFFISVMMVAIVYTIIMAVIKKFG